MPAQLRSALILVFCMLVYAHAQDSNSLGFQLFQVKPRNDMDRELLKEMDEFYPEDAVDFWSHPKDETVEFLVQGELVEDLCSFLTKKNITYRIKNNNVQKSVDEQMKQVVDEEDEFTFRFHKESNKAEFDLFNYHKLEDIYSFVSQMEATFPTKIKVTNLEPRTYEGRQIKLVHVSLDNTKTNIPAIFMDCGIHAREWVSPSFCLYTIDRLIKEGWYGLLYYFDVYLIPVANPDGYAYTWTGSTALEKHMNRFWRKNRNPNSVTDGKPLFKPNKSDLPAFHMSKKTRCMGVDLNRNFNISFGTTSSDDPCSITYHGLKPFSEPETQAFRLGLERAMEDHKKKMVYMSVHSYTQKWMFPNGHTKSQSKDHMDLKYVAQKAVDALRKVHGTIYKSGQISEVIYLASGSSGDWAHEKLGIKYSFALELRDLGQYGFLLPVNQIKPTVEETFAGMVAMAHEVYKELK